MMSVEGYWVLAVLLASVVSLLFVIRRQEDHIERLEAECWHLRNKTRIRKSDARR